MPLPCRSTRTFEVPRTIERPRPTLGAHHPVGVAGDERFLLPARHVALQPLDRMPARVERLGPMRCRDRDHDADLADTELAGPVQQGDPTDRPALADLRGELAEALD